jgi:divalent metal cation (Fe/Co/Zn/Cd) transporter
MTSPVPPSNVQTHTLSPEQYARLKAESRHPYRGFRKVIYAVFAGSGAIGAVIFLAQLLAGREVETALPNLGVQLGVIALMVWLFRLEQKPKRKS